MANLKLLSPRVFVKSTGTGTNSDPYILQVGGITGGSSSGEVSGEVAVSSLPATPAGTNLIGKVGIDQVTANANEIVVKSAIPAGTNNIGDVDVLTMPVTHIIADSGTVTSVTSITNALPAGTNLLGKVSIDQSTANANEVVVKSGTVTAVTSITNALPAGTNAIGKLSANSGVDIGDVDVTSIAAGENHLGAVGGNTVEVDSTPTLTVHASYASGDFVGTSATCITFANCARVNTGTGMIIGATLIDYAVQSIAAELWLFDASVTPPNDSAAWTISDADALKCIGVIPFSSYYASALNSVCNGTIPNGAIPFKSTGTALYGCLVTRGAPTYASGDVSIRLYIAQD